MSLPFQFFVVSLPRTLKSEMDMTIVSTRDFRANQTKFLDMALRGEHVVLKSRRGSVRLIPVEEEEPRRDVTAEICQGMKDWKEYLETGKSDKFRPASELIDEL
jgi:antitoxin (DNA-binding transcriptional repressor) of toxin-antitoxin stability system